MNRAKLPFSVFKRPTRRRKHFIYYVKIRDPAGQYSTALSSTKTNKADANKWAYEQIANGQQLVRASGSPLFSDIMVWLAQIPRSRWRCCRKHQRNERSSLRQRPRSSFDTRGTTTASECSACLPHRRGSGWVSVLAYNEATSLWRRLRNQVKMTGFERQPSITSTLVTIGRSPRGSRRRSGAVSNEFQWPPVIDCRC